MTGRVDSKKLRTLGAYLVRQRYKAGLTAEEFAAKLGVAPSTLSRLENGTREIRLGMLLKFQSQFDLSDDFGVFLRTGAFPQSTSPVTRPKNKS